MKVGEEPVEPRGDRRGRASHAPRQPPYTPRAEVAMDLRPSRVHRCRVRCSLTPKRTAWICGSAPATNCSEGTLYLRRVVRNLVRDDTRAAGRSAAMAPLDGSEPEDACSALDAMLAAEAYARYLRALATLSPRARLALTARLQQGLDYAGVAKVAKCASAAAARAMVGRALERVRGDARCAMRKEWLGVRDDSRRYLVHAALCPIRLPYPLNAG